MRNVLVLPASLSLALAACGGTSSTSQPTAAPTGSDTEPAQQTVAEQQAATAAAPATPPPGFDTLWEEMGRKQRIEVMKKNVVPKVGEAFEAFDSDTFDHVDCTLCHGDGALEGNFDMPNPDLPKLNFGPGWDEYAADHEAILAFMKDQVVPMTAEALGLPPYDPATETGFGCFNCHTPGE